MAEPNDPMRFTPKEKAYTAGAFVGAALASVAALQIVERLIGHKLGDIPELVAAVTFIGVVALALRGVGAIRQERLDQLKEEMREYVRGLNKTK